LPSQADRVDYSIVPKFLRQTVAYNGSEAPGTIIVDTTNKFIYLVEGEGRALRYGIGVRGSRPSRQSANAPIGPRRRKCSHAAPTCRDSSRAASIIHSARALYLGSSLYRIHGSNEPWTIGTNVSSGCVRMRNEDVTDLYGRVKIGTKVIVI